MIKYILLILILAAPAWARDKEQVALCTGAGSCSNGTPIQFGVSDIVEFAVDDETGCSNAAATHSIQGQNAGGSVLWHEVGSVSTIGNEPSSITLDPNLWFPTWRAVASDTTDCSSLEINLWITRY